MSRKIFRTESQRAASRKGLKPPKRKKDKRSYSLPLFFLGGVFLILGTAEAIYPIPFHSSGGLGKTDWGTVTAIYSEGQSRGFGILFILMGLLFLYWGYCAVRNARKKPPTSLHTDH